MTNNGQKLTGLIAAPHTPMNPDGSLDLDTIENQAQLLASNGVCGAFVCGTTGESMSLTVPERLQVAQRWISASPDGFKVIVHVGHTGLAACKTLAAHAQEDGADMIGAMPPCFFKAPDCPALVDFCAEVAAAAPKLSFYYYHIPAMTGVDIEMLDFLKIAVDAIPTMAGVKFTSEDIMDFTRCSVFMGGRFNMLFGRDEILLAGLAVGATGGVGSTYNLAAPLYRRIIEAFNEGDMDTARALQVRSMELIATLKTHGKGCGVLPSGKAAMKLLGVDCGRVRKPLPKLTGSEVEELRRALDEIGFFDYCCEL